MNLNTTNLLKSLGLGIRAPGMPGGGAPAPGIEQVSFADLLKQARDGTLQTNTPVTVDPDCGVQLTDEQLATLSIAADKAEASGIHTALVMIGDQRVILDVHARTVTGSAAAGAGVLAGVDGVIDLSSASITAQPTNTVTGSLSALLNASANAGKGALPPTLTSLAPNSDIMKLLVELEAKS